MRSILAGLIFVIFTGCLSAEDITGKWYLINGKESYDDSQYIEIFENNTAHLRYSEFIAEGSIETVEYGWIFHSDIGDYMLAFVRSIDEFENGSLGIDLINEFEDILIGYFKKVED